MYEGNGFEGNGSEGNGFEIQNRRHGLEVFMASLSQESGETTGVNVQILSGFASINLRGNPENADFVANVTTTLGQQLPLIANTMTFGDYRVFWLGPDEWLIMALAADTPELLVRLRKSLSTQHASVTDSSGGQVSLQFTGPAARDILDKGCTLDFHPDKFRVGCCAQSGLAKASVLIGLIEDTPSFQIVVRRSFAEYLALWLQASAREYGVQFTIS
jgi:sarcosine oxidase subunit gamma